MTFLLFLINILDEEELSEHFMAYNSKSFANKIYIKYNKYKMILKCSDVNSRSAFFDIDFSHKNISES